MFTIALTKSTIAAGSVSGALLITGGSLGVYKSSRSSSGSQTTLTSVSQVRESEQEVISPITEVKRYSFAIFQQGSAQGAATPGQDELVARCQLEDSTLDENCSLSQSEITHSKKWVNLTELKAFSFIALIPKTHISENKNVYKVRVTEAFINEWASHKDKKLNIFDSSQPKETAKPLITLEPKLAIKTNDTYVGQMQYMVGNVTSFTETEPSNKELITAGKSFTCALPTTGTEEYKGCEFYHLGQNDKALSSFSQHQLRMPLTKLTKVEKSFHYLIKFDEPMNIHPTKYEPTSQTLKIKVHNDPHRKEPATTGITTINLQYLSPTIIFDKNNQADLAVVL